MSDPDRITALEKAVVALNKRLNVTRWTLVLVAAVYLVVEINR